MKSILDYIPSLRKKNDDEYAGPCPWCGGEDRFVVWPKQGGKGGRFMCRRCNQRGDTIDFLRSNGLSYSQALKELGAQDTVEAKPTEPPRDSMPPTNEIHPSQIWITQATRFVVKCSSHTEPKAISDLNEALKQRHLSMETAKRFGIAFNPEDLYISCQDWGIPGDKFKIPKGLVIPTPRREGVVNIKIRLPDGSNGPKYWQVKGGGHCCLILGGNSIPVLVVESDLDAYLIWQESKRRVGVVSIGGTNKPLDNDAIRYLKQATAIIIATDNDEAGKQAYQLLREQFPRALYHPPAEGKDPCEMQTLGTPVTTWIGGLLGRMESPSSEKRIRLPRGFPSTWKKFQKQINNYPNLIPCPRTPTPWHWVNRSDCGTCTGHIQCLKNVLPTHPPQPLTEEKASMKIKQEDAPCK